MSTDKILLTKILRKLTKTVQKLEDSTFQELLENEFSLQIAITRKDEQACSPNRKGKGFSSKEINDIIDHLRAMEDREEAQEILEQRCNTKAKLGELVRALDLPLRKRDTKKRMIEKITDATIGYRLRSKAIRDDKAE